MSTPVSKWGRLENLLSTKEGTHIITVPPYTFVVAHVNNHLTVIDLTLGGNLDTNAGIVAAFDCLVSAKIWLLCRLRVAKV